MQPGIGKEIAGNLNGVRFEVFTAVTIKYAVV
jgi:hypothetical protein